MNTTNEITDRLQTTDIVKIVIETVATNLVVNETTVKLQSTLIEDLGMDSLDIVEIIIDLECEFDIEIKDDDGCYEKAFTVQGLVELVEEGLL